MRWMPCGLVAALVQCAPTSAAAATVYLCKAYSGGTFYGKFMHQNYTAPKAARPSAAS